MRLLGAETKKLFSSRFLCFLFVALLLLCFAITFFTTEPRPTEAATQQAFCDILESPEEMALYNKQLEDLVRIHFRDENYPYPTTYMPGTEYDDHTILGSAYNRMDYLDGYPAAIEKIIRSTERHLDDLYSYGYTDQHYEVRARLSLVAAYRSLLEQIDLDREYAYGYDVYLKNDISAIFIWLLVTTATAYIFLNDKSTGFYSIMKTTAGGQAASAKAKLTLTVLLAAIVTLLLRLATFVAILLRTGMSSPFAPIQLLPDYLNVPYSVSILSYLLIHLGLQMLGFTIYALFVAVISSARPSYLLCFGAGAIFTAATLLPRFITYVGSIPAIHYVNGSSLVFCNELLSFWRTANVFGFAVPHVTLLVCLALTAAALLGFATLLIFNNGSRGGVLSPKENERLKRLRNTILGIPESIRKKLPVLRLPIWMFELKKNRIGLVSLLLAAVFFAHLYMVGNQVGAMNAFGEARYYKYICDVKDLNSADRADYLIAERTRLENVILAYDSQTEAFESGRLSPEDYFEYLDTYHKVKAENYAFERVEQYISYLERKNPETGADGKIIYTTGYEAFFGLPPGWLPYAAILLVTAGAFSVEYGAGGGFANILRTTAKGRRCVYRTKLLIFAGMGALIAVAFRAAALLTVANRYALSDFGSPLHSITSFSVITSNITIGGFLWLDLALQAFFGAALATVVLVLSYWNRRLFSTLCLALVTTGIPAILTQTVFKYCPEISIVSFTTPAVLFTRSARMRMFSADLGYLAIVTAAYLVLITIAGAFTKRHYEIGTFRPRGR